MQVLIHLQSVLYALQGNLLTISSGTFKIKNFAEILREQFIMIFQIKPNLITIPKGRTMKYFVLFILIMVVASCKSDVVDPGKETPGSMNLSLEKTNIPSGVVVIRVTLSKNNFDDIVKDLDLLNETSAEIQVEELAVGTWHIKAEALDSDQKVLYTGESDIEIKSEEVTPVSITLSPVTENFGGIYINANWDDFIKNWFDQPTNPLIQKTSGTYQKFGVTQPYVLYEDGVYKMWYAGLVDSLKTYMFYATSTDGLQWHQYGYTPVLSPEDGKWDAGHVSPGPVIKINGVYKMFYNGWSEQSSNWSIGLATSTDGIQWTKSGQYPILSGSGWDKQMVARSVVKYDSVYYLYYSGMNNNSNQYEIGIARSTDGVSWTKENSPIMIPTQEWEAGSVGYPSVVYENNVFRMVYQGGGDQCSFSIAYSSDGINWSKYYNQPFFTQAKSIYGTKRIGCPFLLKLQNEYRIYYTGTQSSSNNNEMNSICVARKFTGE